MGWFNFTKIEAAAPVIPSTIMSAQPSRQYLQGLPEMKRRERREQELKQQLDRLFQLISNPVMAAAELGETKYLYDMKPWIQEQQELHHGRFQQQHRQEVQQLTMLGRNEQISRKEQQFNAQMQAYHNGQALLAAAAAAAAEPPSDELLTGLKEKFPDCAVSFPEDWVETRQGVKELKKGILIDWL
jgi:hypothetical protein